MSSANQRRRLRPQHRSVRRHIGYSSHDSSSYRFSPDICLSLSSSLRQSLLHGLSATSLPGGGIRLETHLRSGALSLLLGPYPVALGPSLSWGLPKHKGFYGAMSSAAVAGGVGNPILLKVLSH
ncbi:unnamed protein product [Pleuronectes platessa]|uniref:Uncharacterized protein n=1 Tax=Pleuronectes platessa TaxID=8262 RepID=A0A9N7ZC84_PLEPL|nr:unnamed protein product [Pleuronectes platessa]